MRAVWGPAGSMRAGRVPADGARAGRGPVRGLAAGSVLAGVVLAALALAGCGSGGGGGAAGDAAGLPAESAREARPAGHFPDPGMAWVILGADTVFAEVAGTPDQRERGLMGRESVPDGTGMLFVFPDSEERFIWMRDTHVALDVAFFDARERIAAIKPLEPLDETLVGSDIATALVLEVRQGWFADRGIVVGTQAEFVFGSGLSVR